MNANRETANNAQRAAVKRMDLSQYEQLMNQLLKQSAHDLDEPPHKLVRILRGGKVIWTTVSQARQMIDFHRNHYISDDSDLVAREIEKALHGDLNLLEDELMILICIARSECGGAEDQRIKVQRKWEATVDLVSDIRESECELNRQKQEKTILGEFEEKMGLMLQARQEGAEKKAKRLADELRAMRNRYVLYSRSIQPMLSKIHCLRTDLVKMKEKILSSLLDALNDKSDSLTVDRDHLKQSIAELEDELDGVEGRADSELAAIGDRLHRLRKDLDANASRIELVHCEKQAMRQELEITRQTVRELDRGAGEEQMDEALRKAQSPKLNLAPKAAAPAKSKNSRMTIQTD